MKNKLILFILIVGILYRLFLTAHGNFIFNMDNARDFVDVREMVEVGKLRLIGPTSAIDGLYTGPLWYYLLAIPYLLSGGNPYAAILMQFIFWAIGGFYLLKLIQRYSKWLIVPIGLIWIASNYVVLANVYSFNPNPVLLLTPLLIYSLVECIGEKKDKWIIIAWALAAAFFNLEMNAGFFIPFIILISILWFDKKLFKNKFFWIGVFVFILSLLPQILFDLRHQFVMSKALINFLTESKNSSDILQRIGLTADMFHRVLEATLMNQKQLTYFLEILFFLIFIKNIFAKNSKNYIFYISSLFFLIPFLGYLIIPVTVNMWHLGDFSASALILIGFILFSSWKSNLLGKVVSFFLSITIIYFSFLNIFYSFTTNFGKPSLDPSEYSNEIKAIDYVYKEAKGQDFKVYTYLPSVYDYPYQYLFWWYGRKKYGYLPKEYAYLPNKPKYIPSQEYFQSKDVGRVNSRKVFLIKEPNRNYTLYGWEGELIKLKSISKTQLGPIEVEIKEE